MPSSPVLSKSEGLPGFTIWNLAVSVEPYLAYRVSWTTDLSSVSSNGSSLQWQNLGEELTSCRMYPKQLPVFVTVDYLAAYAPHLFPKELLALLQVAVEADLEIAQRDEENRFDATYVEVEDGIEVTFSAGSLLIEPI